MLSSDQFRLEIDLSLSVYLIFKSASNGIGEYGVMQLSKCHWHNLSSINLSNAKIIKITI